MPCPGAPLSTEPSLTMRQCKKRLDFTVQRSAGGRTKPQSSPSPSPSPSPSSPSCPQIPSPEAKSGAFFRASSSLSASPSSAIRLRKKNHPAARAMHRKPIQSSHASTSSPPVATAAFPSIRRNRFSRSRLPGGRSLCRLPAVSPFLPERAPVVPQIPLLRNKMPMKPKGS